MALKAILLSNTKLLVTRGTLCRIGEWVMLSQKAQAVSRSVGGITGCHFFVILCCSKN
jgi:hypothetical protein